ncbi:MAG: YggS family pyridoxal phosphate-dependent enzyme [Candidatus Micrarchaeota archaeon]
MITENYRIVLGKIGDACIKSGRKPASIRLIAVSKMQPIERIIEASNLGISDFGENRIQEAQQKIGRLRNFKLTWHLVGRLQANKVKKAVSLFDVIHSVSSLEVAEKINDEAGKLDKHQKILLQVNISGEPTKGGFTEQGLATAFPKLLQLPHITLLGLMTIAPLADNPELSRPIFKKMCKLRNDLEKTHSVSLPELSMGMSQDFEVAIEEGSTMVRIGTALFGERKQGK